jgi:formylglycine-generating enzyme required for sulfatase activity
MHLTPDQTTSAPNGIAFSHRQAVHGFVASWRGESPMGDGHAERAGGGSLAGTFEIGLHPVTNVQFDAFVADGPRTTLCLPDLPR